MQEQSSGRTNREPTTAKRGHLLDFFSGIDPEIRNELPPADHFPYILIGFTNLVASILIGMLAYLFFESILHSYYLAIFFAWLIFSLAVIVLRAITTSFLSKTYQSVRYVYLICIPVIAIVCSQPVGMFISEVNLVREKRTTLISDTVQWTKDTAQFRLTADAYQDSVKLFEMSGVKARMKADSLYKVIVSKKKDSIAIQRSIRALQNNLQIEEKKGKSPEQTNNNNYAAAVEETKKLKQQLDQQTGALALLKTDLSNVRISYQILSNPISELPYVKELYINKYQDSIASQRKKAEMLVSRIRENRAQIALLEGVTTCNTCTFSEKFAYYRQHVFSSWLILFVSTTVFLLLLLFLFLPPYIVSRSRNDLYHQLLATKENSETISIRRKEIEEKFKIETEMKTVKDLLQKFDGGGNESTQDITNNLTSTNDPKAYEALGDVQVKLGDFFRAVEFYDRAIFLDPETSTPWRKKAEVYSLMGRYAEEQQAKARYTELLNAERFRNNLTRATRLNAIEVANLPFYGSFSWHIRGSMNIMLGKNGYGKSHLMSIMLALLQEEEKLLRDLTMMDKVSPTPAPFLKITFKSDHERDVPLMESLQQQIEEKSKLRAAFLARQRASRTPSIQTVTEITPPVTTEWDGELIRLQKQLELLEGIAYFDKLGIQSSYGKIPVLAIPDSRFINKSAESTSIRNDERSKKILENGAYQFMLQVPYEDVIQNLLNTISTIYLDERNFEDEIFQLIRRVFKRLTGSEFVWDTIQRTEDNSGFIIKVKTEGADTSLPIQKASQGTLSVVAMIGTMYHYMSLRYPAVSRKQVTRQPAIIFIDEIDAHLHPSWQQKIIGILRNEFPNVQFIISAHSPLVIAGCKEEEVCVLRKRDKGFTMEIIESNLIGKPIADIFRMIFEVEEKNEMYLQLAALMPFKNSIKSKAQALREKTTRDEKEEQQLQELEQQIENFVYLEQFDTIRSTFEELEDLKNANETLRMEVERLRARLG
jgi:predicted ATP-binding protein involved in virulence